MKPERSFEVVVRVRDLRGVDVWIDTTPRTIAGPTFHAARAAFAVEVRVDPDDIRPAQRVSHATGEALS